MPMKHVSRIWTMRGLGGFGGVLLGIASASAHDRNAANYTTQLPSDQVATVEFGSGEVTLDNSDKKSLDDLVAKNMRNARIKDVKVLAWSDHEYPSAGQKATKSDVDLADQRGKNVRAYIKDHFKVSDVDTYNMAERPNGVEKLFSTSDFEMKAATETGKTNIDPSSEHKSSAVIVITRR